MNPLLMPLVVGGAIAGICVVIHAIGTSILISSLSHARFSVNGPRRVLAELVVLVIAASGLLLIHLFEVSLWAIAYLKIAKIPGFTVGSSLYFSMVTFTSLGYGDITLKGVWGLLCGVEAMIGLLLFGWSTALLYAVVRRLREIRTG